MPNEHRYGTERPRLRLGLGLGMFSDVDVGDDTDDRVGVLAGVVMKALVVSPRMEVSHTELE